MLVPICNNDPPSMVKPSQPQLTVNPNILATAAPVNNGTKVAVKNGNRMMTIHVNTFVIKLIFGLTSSGVLLVSGVVTPQYPICSPFLSLVGVIFMWQGISFFALSKKTVSPLHSPFSTAIFNHFTTWPSTT